VVPARDTAAGLDLASQRIVCRHRPTVAYDVLSIGVGPAEHRVAVKPSDRVFAHGDPLRRLLTRALSRLKPVSAVR
jgi:hypothetical protein